MSYVHHSILSDKSLSIYDGKLHESIVVAFPLYISSFLFIHNHIGKKLFLACIFFNFKTDVNKSLFLFLFLFLFLLHMITHIDTELSIWSYHTSYN